jgi:hypothetical protein
LSLTQTLSPRLIGQVTYELGYAEGYQASPYRFVPVRMSIDSAPELWVPETDPDTRYRHAVVIGANQAIGEASSLQGDYRLYRDTWGIWSHTVGARYFAHISKRVELRLRERFYTQSSASFYVDSQTDAAGFPIFPDLAPGQLNSGDQRLSAFGAITLGIKAEVRITPLWTVDGKFEGYEQRPSWRLGGQGSTGLDPFRATFMQLGASRRF